MATIDKWTETQDRQYIVLLPPHSVMLCHRDEELRRATEGSALTLPDGIGIIVAAKLLGYPNHGRVTGPLLMLKLCDWGRAKAYKHFFYGGAPGVADKLASELSARYSGLKVAGAYSPPFREPDVDEDTQIVRAINSRRPDIVWVGLGSPKQEKWMAKHIGRIDCTALIGVGAAFDFHSGRVPWAPKWIRDAGLEWAYRLATEPKRMWRRNVNSPLFLAKVLLQASRFRRARKAYEAEGKSVSAALLQPQDSNKIPSAFVSVGMQKGGVAEIDAGSQVQQDSRDESRHRATVVPLGSPAGATARSPSEIDAGSFSGIAGNQGCFTIDVEDWYHILGSRGVPTMESWATLERRFHIGLERLLRMLDEFGVRATMFWLGWLAERNPGLVRRCHDLGHEIASHGYGHVCVHDVGAKNYARDILTGKALLEDILGCAVSGFRAAGFHFDGNNQWVFEKIRAAGFHYDSSILPTTRIQGTWPLSATVPHIRETESGPLVELPASVICIAGVRLCFFGGGYLRITPTWLLEWGVRRLRRSGRPLLAYVHPREVDPDHPRLHLPAVRRFKCYVNLSSTAQKLRLLLRHREFMTMREMAGRMVSNRGNPPALPGDSQSLTYTGVVHQSDNL